MAGMRCGWHRRAVLFLGRLLWLRARSHGTPRQHGARDVRSFARQRYEYRRRVASVLGVIAVACTTAGAGTLIVSAVTAGPAAASTPETTGRLFTIAGDPTIGTGTSGDGGPANVALLGSPGAVTIDAFGNTYIADSANYRVQEISGPNHTQWGMAMTDGYIYTIAGQASGTSGTPTSGEAATDAALGTITAIALDSSGDLFIADADDSEVDEVPASDGTQFGISMTAGDIYVIAGDGSPGFSGDGSASIDSELDSPAGLAIDSSGDVYIADSGNAVVREIAAVDGTQWGQPMTTGAIYTVVGMGDSFGDSGVGGPATEAQLCSPSALALDPSGNLYLADSCNSVVQEVPLASGSQWGQSMTGGDLYTVAGTDGTSGITNDDGPAASAQLDGVDGVAFDGNGDLYLSDAANNRVMEVPSITQTQWGIPMTADDIYTVAGDSGGGGGFSDDGDYATGSLLDLPGGLALTVQGDLYLADTGNDRIVIVPSSEIAGDIYTFAGTGLPGQGGDGGPATASAFEYPDGIAMDPQGNIYIADEYNGRVQEVAQSNYQTTPSGQSMTANDIYTIAGSAAGDTGTGGDGGPATSALLTTPYGMYIDGSGNLYIADANACNVREVAAHHHTQWGVSMTAGDIYTIVGSASGTCGDSGDGTSATSALLNGPSGLTVDSKGNLYVSDTLNQRVIEVPATSHSQWGMLMTADDIYTIAGSTSGVGGHSGDGGSARDALLADPLGLLVDAYGDLVIDDGNSDTVRAIASATGRHWGLSMTAGDIYDLVGHEGDYAVGDDNVSGPSSYLNYPDGIAQDPEGDLVIADENNSRVQELSRTDQTQWGQSMTAGDVYTIAGDPDGTSGSAPDGSPATSASLLAPAAVAVDANGNVYIADFDGLVSRLVASSTIVPPAGGPITTDSELGGGDSIDPGACDACDGSVNPAAGDYYQSDTDVSVPGYGGGLSLTRTYDALSAQAEASASSPSPGPFGYGWTDSYSTHLEPAGGATSLSPTSSVTFVDSSGAMENFDPESGGMCSSPETGPGGTDSYCALPRVLASLVYDSSSSTYVLTTPGSGTQSFDSSGRLVSITDLSGDTTSFSYGSPAPGSGDCPSSAGSCETVTSPSGRAMVIGWSGSSESGFISSVTDPMGRTWRYGYDANDNLTSVTDPMGNVTSYSYDTGNANTALRHDLLSITAPDAQPGGPDAGQSSSFTYDTSGRLTSQTDPLGRTTGYNYSGLDRSGDGNVVITDPEGRTTTDDMAAGEMRKQTVDDAASHLDYDPSSTLETETIDPNGHDTTNQYLDGNLISSTDPADQTTTSSYVTTGAENDEVCSTSVAATEQCGTDGVSPPSPLSSGTTDIPVPDSPPPLGVTYTEYDANGNAVWTTTGVYAPDGTTLLDQRTTYTLYGDDYVDLDGSDVSCDAVPPSSSLPCATINADGVVTQLAYDSYGDLVSSSTPDGNGSELATTTYTYNADGQQTSTTSPKGNLSGADAADYTTTTTYNADGQPTVVTTGAGSGSTVTPRSTITTYDQNGNAVLSSRTTGAISLVGTASGSAGSADSLSVSLPSGTRAGDEAVLATTSGTLPGFGSLLQLPAGDIEVLASGSGAFGDPNGQPFLDAAVQHPSAVAVDADGDIYIADQAADQVYELAAATGTQWGQSMTAGEIYSIVGTDDTSGTTGDGGAGASALLNAPDGLVLDSAGDLYIADSGNNRVQELAATSGTQWGQSMSPDHIYTIAGDPSGSPGTSGDGDAADLALLDDPEGLVLDAAGDLYIADSGNNRVQELAATSGTQWGQSMAPGDIYTVTGDPSGSSGYSGDGTAVGSALLAAPKALAVDAAGDLFVADSGNNRVQELAATSASQWGQSMTAGDTYTVTGDPSGSSGSSGDGTAVGSAFLDAPDGLALDPAGDLYVADGGNNRIQELAATSGTQWGQSMSAGDIYTVTGDPSGSSGSSGDGGAAGSALLNAPQGLASDASGDLFIADGANSSVQEMTPVSTVAFQGRSDYLYPLVDEAGNGTLNGEQAGETSVNGGLNGVAVDPSGDVYFADQWGNQVQEYAATTHTQWGISMTAGDVYVILGDAAGDAGSSGDDGAGTSALLNYPMGVALDSSGDLYVADLNNNRVQELSASDHSQWGQSMSTGDAYTVAGGAYGGLSELATNSWIGAPAGVAVDAQGDLFIAPEDDNHIVEVAGQNSTQFDQQMTAGYAYLVAGAMDGQTGASANGTPWYSSLLGSGPGGIAVDAEGDLFISDSGNNRVVEIPASSGTQYGIPMTAGDLYTIAGSPQLVAGSPEWNCGSSGLGGPGGTATLCNPNQIAVDASGDVYVADANNNRVLELAASSGTQWGQSMSAGDLYDVIGSATTSSGNADGGTGTSALLNTPQGVAVDQAGDVFVTDVGSNRVRELVSPSGALALPGAAAPPGYAELSEVSASDSITQVFAHNLQPGETSLELSYPGAVR